jgi:hypothetical protein
MTEDQLENFIAIISGLEYGFSSLDCLYCIELARQEMLAGRTSPEIYFKAKEILINLVECASIVQN